jgi:hypothetical protein
MKTSLEAALELYPPHGIQIIEGRWQSLGNIFVSEVTEVWAVVARVNHEAHGTAARAERHCFTEKDALDNAATDAVNQNRDMIVIHYLKSEKKSFAV